jgi:hypothetical protein
MRRHSPSDFGTNPIGYMCKFEIGKRENGPKILPIETSDCNFSKVSCLNCSTERKFFVIKKVRGPVY